MQRSDFLKKGFGFLGMAVIAPSILGASKATAACTAANNETAGPFPTINPANYNRSNIVDGRTGVGFTININIKNINANCGVLAGALVDIWHCDKDGNYSQYGGTGMQSTNYTALNFLRGRQTSDANGLVSFTSKFPGWYTGRATHIHMHVYDSSGTSLAITQIAFPEGTGSAVETVNAATAQGYTKGMNGYTYNAQDNVFSDGTGTEMSSITGDVANGYVLNFDCYVRGPQASGVSNEEAEKQFQVRQNFPNPCSDYTRIPLTLRTASEVTVSIVSIDGKVVSIQKSGTLPAGEQMLDLDVVKLAAGRYVYNVKIINSAGTFTQSRLFEKQ